MKERPILFSAPMVRALLAGTKTQTRRVVKARNDPDYGCQMSPGEIAGDERAARLCPYGQPGDRLWVRETWQAVSGTERARRIVENQRPSFGWVEYAAGPNGAVNELPPKWRPSIHMPRWASRITLEVTGVRVERLQDISEADTVAEGIPAGEVSPSDAGRFAYRLLWEQINGAGSWGANPWVWVVEFKRLEGGAA